MSTTPQRLGKYELQQSLGCGSTGEVWKAYDLQARCDVAVKLLHPDLLQTDPNFMASFMKEWQSISSLHHPNIVQVRNVNISRPSSSSGTTPYIVMDYIEGQTTLADYIQRTSRVGKFPSVSAIVYLFTHLGLAVDYAHEQGITHGNIKPANILLDIHNTSNIASGEPLLTDFGIASLPGNRTTSSPLYLAPEKAKGLNAEPASDIYSLGVILYEICTGVLPFHGESHIAIMMHHINTLPTPPGLINPNIPPALSEVILRAMAKDPHTRFATASLLAEAIAEACSVAQTPHLTLNKTQSSDEEPLYYSTGPLRIPQTRTQPAYDMTSILGVSQPLPGISSGKHMALARQNTSVTPPMADRDSTSNQFPITQLQTQTSGKLPTPSMKLPTPPLPPSRSPFNNRSSPLVMIIILLLLLLVVASLGVGLLIHSSGQQTALGLVAGHVFIQDDALGHEDVLRIELQNIPAPPSGKRYFAWLQNTTGQAVPLGSLTAQNGSSTLIYAGNAHHSNLLATIQAVFVTLENDGNTTPSAPSTSAKVYQAGFTAAAFQYIQHILYMQPGFPSNSSLAVGLIEAMRGINDKAGSIADSLQGKQDVPLAKRQATRIIELIDGSQYARSSGDLPASLLDMLSLPVGLISSPTQTGYIDALSAQIARVTETAGDNTELHQHAQNVSSALADLENWIQKMRTYDVQILKAANLNNPVIINTALQLKQMAQDAYTGRTIPPNPGPLPTLGSAGAYQAFVECQYMATLDIEKVP